MAILQRNRNKNNSEILTLVANGSPPSSQLLEKCIRMSEGLVAIDGGLVYCDQAHFEPDLILGDFDSAPPHLLEKAIAFLYNFGFENLIVLGALGKRIDHTLTNICLLSRYPGKIRFESENETCFALPKLYELCCRPGQKLSLLPISAEVRGVTTRGVKWELENQTWSHAFMRISNEAVDKSVTITFEEGDLLLTINGD